MLVISELILYTLKMSGSSKNPLNELSEDDKHLAREAWFMVENNYYLISKALFSEWLFRYPDHKKFFVGLFEFNETGDIWTNPIFERHMIQALLPSLGAIIKDIDRPESLRKFMIKLGLSHKVKDIGLKKKDIEILRNMILETLQTFLGPKISAGHLAALDKVFAEAFQIFEDALRGKLFL